MMTLTVNGKVSAPEGLELEVIETHTGVECRRYRVANGADVSLIVFEPRTLILREVPVASSLEQKQGEQRHGTLDVPDTAKPGLEDGGLVVGDPVLAELEDDVMGGAHNVMSLVGKLVESNGEPIQLQVYEELLIAHGEYKKSCALADAREEFLSSAEGVA